MVAIGQVHPEIPRIKLPEPEGHELKALRDQRRSKASSIMHAVALLLTDEGPRGPALKDTGIHANARISIRQLERLGLGYCEVGPPAALVRKSRSTSGREVKITGEV